MTGKSALIFDQDSRTWLSPFLPTTSTPTTSTRPFTTLTYAQSLDSQLALAPGVRTTLSGQETKALTHYLRSRHDAILVGVGTALADDPALNCRLDDAVGDLTKQPRPIVLDARGEWDVRGSECLKLARLGKTKAPWICTTRTREQMMKEWGEDATGEFEAADGRIVALERVEGRSRLSWSVVLQRLGEMGIRSVMIEGGGSVINSLLEPENVHLVDSVIITIAPTWLGHGGVLINPARGQSESGQALPSIRLTETRWRQFGEDVVVCGRILKQG